jgi:hypothetical protein
LKNETEHEYEAPITFEELRWIEGHVSYVLANRTLEILERGHIEVAFFNRFREAMDLAAGGFLFYWN